MTNREIPLMIAGMAGGPDAGRAERKRLGLLIKEAREGVGLLQRQLGPACGVNNVTVSKWESGLNPVKAEHIATIARVTNRPLEFFYPDGVPASVTLAAKAQEAAIPPSSPTSPHAGALERRVEMLEAALAEAAQSERLRVLLLEQIVRGIEDMRSQLGTLSAPRRSAKAAPARGRSKPRSS